MNRIIKIEFLLSPITGAWAVLVTKEFSAEYGGGLQTFAESANSIEDALDLARSMTLPAATRSNLIVTSPKNEESSDPVHGPAREGWGVDPTYGR